MNKKQMITFLSRALKVSRKDAARYYSTLFDAISGALMANKHLRTPMGTFKVVKRKARMGRNPQTGKPLKIPARKVVVFKPSKLLRGLAGDVRTGSFEYDLDNKRILDRIDFLQAGNDIQQRVAHNISLYLIQTLNDSLSI